MATTNKELLRRRCRGAYELCEAQIEEIKKQWEEAKAKAQGCSSEALALIGIPFVKRIHAAQAERDAILKAARVERGWH